MIYLLMVGHLVTMYVICIPSGKPVEFAPVYVAVFVPPSTSRWLHTCTPK